MARQAQGWKCFHEDKVTKATGSLLAVLSLALQLQPLVMDWFGGGGSAAAQKEMESDHKFCI